MWPRGAGRSMVDMLSRSPRAALGGALLALLCAGVASSPAAAAPPAHVTYDVTIDADIVYDHARHSESHGGGRDNVLDQGWHLTGNLRSTLPMVSFTNGRMDP